VGSKGEHKDSLGRKGREGFEGVLVERNGGNLHRVGGKKRGLIFWTCQNEEEKVAN